MENNNINQKWVNMVNNAVFPIILTTDNGTVEGQGLTKRELFAAMAMEKICTAPEFGSPESMAKYALKCADALINELNKE